MVKGYKQQYNLDYDQTFAFIVETIFYKTLFTLATIHFLEIEQIDVETAFLNGKLAQEVYVD